MNYSLLPVVEQKVDRSLMVLAAVHPHSLTCLMVLADKHHTIVLQQCRIRDSAASHINLSLPSLKFPNT